MPSYYTCFFSYNSDINKFKTIVGVKKIAHRKQNNNYLVYQRSNITVRNNLNIGEESVNLGILNNPGQSVFPGGKDSGDAGVEAAIRELIEETGITVNTINERTLNISLSTDQIFTCSYCIKGFNENKFYSLYIRLPSLENLTALSNHINNNIQIGQSIADDELQSVGVEELTVQNLKILNRNYTKTLKNMAILTTPRNSDEWNNQYLLHELKLFENEAKTRYHTDSIKKKVLTVKSFYDDDLKNIHESIKNFANKQFVLGSITNNHDGTTKFTRTTQISVMNPNSSHPNRFRTEWFSMIAAYIKDANEEMNKNVNQIVTTQPNDFDNVLQFINKNKNSMKSKK
mmetsp:Transcript_24847/g.22561  ORF Transcript_24847/g.22561 Transcript_24847/m.22561 type:complete len:344 (+) Transcript_24847:23-1054(+)